MDKTIMVLVIAQAVMFIIGAAIMTTWVWL